jgi:hypothetical protein
MYRLMAPNRVYPSGKDPTSIPHVPPHTEVGCAEGPPAHDHTLGKSLGVGDHADVFYHPSSICSSWRAKQKKLQP